MEELQYKAVFSFELLLSSCKIGKEGIDQEIMAALKRQEEKGLYPIKWNRETSANGDVVLKYEGAPFTNLTGNGGTGTCFMKNRSRILINN